MALVAALNLLGADARSQESVFGLQFLGSSEETGDIRARALGTQGIAIADSQSAITLNPARHARLGRMTISILGLAGWRTATDGTLDDRRALARFPHQRVALPIFGRAVLSAGFVGWRDFQGDFVLPARTVGGFEYVQAFTRRGTLYTIPVGVAGSLGRWVDAGVTLDLIFGTVDESWTDRGDSLVALRTRRRDTFSGKGVTLGAVLHPAPGVTAGVSWSPQIHVDRTTRTTIEDERSPSAAPIRDTAVLAEVDLPQVVRAGAAWQIDRRWMLAADGAWRDWEAYTGRLYGAADAGAETRLGGGLEFAPSGGGFLGRLRYRAGVSRTTWPQATNGVRLHDMALHLGAGLDLRGGHGRADVGFEVVRSGNLDDNGLRETSWRFLVGLSGQEIWRRKSPRP